MNFVKKVPDNAAAVAIPQPPKKTRMYIYKHTGECFKYIFIIKRTLFLIIPYKSHLGYKPKAVQNSTSKTFLSLTSHL